MKNFGIDYIILNEREIKDVSKIFDFINKPGENSDLYERISDACTSAAKVDYEEDNICKYFGEGDLQKQNIEKIYNEILNNLKKVKKN